MCSAKSLEFELADFTAAGAGATIRVLFFRSVEIVSDDVLYNRCSDE